MNPDLTEPEHHDKLPPQAMTSRTIHSEEPDVLRSASLDASTVPSSASSITPLRPILTTSPSTEKDDRETPSNRPPARPLPVLPNESVPQIVRTSFPRSNDQTRSIALERRVSTGPRSALDWIIPLDDKPTREKTVGERLNPTLHNAIIQKDKFILRAKWTGYALNAAIGMQVVLGALTTGLSVVTTGRQTSIMTAILGGLATIVVSYLARARGSNEPEVSNTRVKDLDQFVRACEAFKMDHGHMLGDTYDHELESFRLRFEELLGNMHGERRSTPV